jgi:hypothetical protein
MWSTRTNVRFNKRLVGIYARPEKILARTHHCGHAAAGRTNSAHSGVGRSAVHLHLVLGCQLEFVEGSVIFTRLYRP